MNESGSDSASPTVTEPVTVPVAGFGELTAVVPAGVVLAGAIDTVTGTAMVRP